MRSEEILAADKAAGITLTAACGDIEATPTVATTEERAAIVEFEASHSRDEAQQLAALG